ncbi:MAG: ABC transporter permease [Bacteroidetes bacterium]|nr:ABC transporter permease [Bacteroidota bacterium]MBS1648582.1 ABC transporter permease [Bacteroidota bacterium]
MLQLIKIEWLKIKRYPAFWWMFSIVALTYPGVNLIIGTIYNHTLVRTADKKEALSQIAKMLFGNPFEFPEAWHTTAYFSSFFISIPAILVIMLISNEYTYKTHRQNIIDGWSRQQFITAKMMDIVIISLITTIIYTFVSVSLGVYFDDGHLARWAEQLQYIPLFFIQSFAQLSIAFLLGYLIKKAFIALGVFLFYSLIVENILVSYLKWKLQTHAYKFLPFEMSDELIPVPAFAGGFGKDMRDAYEAAITAIPIQLVCTLIFTGLIWLLCYKLQEKKDL